MRIVLLSLFLAGCFAGGGGGQAASAPAPEPLLTEFPWNSCNPAPITERAGFVPKNADAATFRAKYQSGAAVYIAVIGDSTTYGVGQGTSPSAVLLLDNHVKTVNPLSVVHNYGIGGAQASTHVAYSTVATVAALVPKPDAVVIALGINDTVMKVFQKQDTETLIAQVRSYGMLPILAHENNMACMTASVPSPFWMYIRNEIDLMAIRTQVDVIDLGTPDGALDYSLLFDQAHPNGAGYQRIFEKYRAWLESV